MSVDTLLSHLGGVRRTGTGRWLAKCPAHEDRKASLTIRELEDGRLLIHDFAGCAPNEVLAAVGLDFDALYPQRALGNHLKGERRPFSSIDVLRAVGYEALVVACAASSVANGQELSSEDRARLLTSAARVQAAIVESGYAR